MTGLTGLFRWYLLISCLVVFVSVFLWMLFSAWRHHRGSAATMGNFHTSVVVEVCWVLAPLVIVMLLVWPVVRDVMGNSGYAGLVTPEESVNIGRVVDEMIIVNRRIKDVGICKA